MFNLYGFCCSYALYTYIVTFDIQQNLVNHENMTEEKRPLPWGLNSAKPGTIKGKDKDSQTKLQAFTLGMQKKTPFQRQKEAEEAKKKKESEEAAKAYAEFVASFEDDGRSGGKAFVKGETIIPKTTFDHEAANKDLSVPVKKSLYKPMPFVKSATVLHARQEGEEKEEEVQKEEEDMSEKKDEKKDAGLAKKRNLDLFLEEIKKEQEEREERLRLKHIRVTGVSANDDEEAVSIGGLTVKAAFENNQGSHDTGDPNTTNLYVGNLNPTVTEHELCTEFARYGPIASVKIMWPRSQEEKERARNCGFVSFMARPDAERALKALDGKEIRGYAMRVGWGKRVALPAKPIFVFEDNVQKAPSPPSGLPFNAQLVQPKAPIGIPPPGTAPAKPRFEVHVHIPPNPHVRHVIHRTIERVIRYGPLFEACIMDREWQSPRFQFLFNNDNPEHVYYRWKLFSILQGDDIKKWRTEPFQMFDDDIWWVPPEVPFDDGDALMLENSDEEDAREKEFQLKGTLGKIARGRLEGLLRKATTQRGHIAKTMMVALEHADAADEVIEIVIKSLLQPTSPLPVKLARLYVVSDILHNSSRPLPNAWKFRSGFEGRLGDVFLHFNVIYRGIEGRLKAEQLRRQITNILTVWDTWMVFPKQTIETFEEIFVRRKEGAVDLPINTDSAEEDVMETE